MRFLIPGVNRRPLRGTERADKVVGDPATGGWIQIGIYDKAPAPITLLGGDDRVLASTSTESDRGAALVLNSVLDTGPGDDRVLGRGTSRGISFGESGLVAGPGRDRITGRADDTAIYMNGYFYTGPGDDLIEARRGNKTLLPQVGLDLGLGRVRTGKGNDRVVARGSLVGLLISDDGGLSTGSGDDVVDVLRGGLRYVYSGFDTSRSLFSLGPGDDRLIGFSGLPGLVNEGISSTPIVEGWSGLDTLVLPQGTYSIVDSTVSGTSSTLKALGFERLAGVTGGELGFADGSFRVDDAGIQMI